MKCFRVTFMMILCVLMTSLTVFATENIDDPIVEIETPEELWDYMPGLGNMTVSEVRDAFDFRFFSEFGIRVLTEVAPDAARSFALLLGLFLVASILRAFGNTIAGGTLQTALELVSMLAMAGAVFSVTETAFGFADGYIETLSEFLRSTTPVLAGFMAAGGKFTSASAISGVIYLAVSLLQSVAVEVLFPLIRLSLCLSVISSVFHIDGVAGIAPYLRKIISYIFGFVTLCLSAVLMFQGVIAKSADSLALRGIRFAIGNFVPFVGGAVNEALTTVVGGLNKVRSVTGATGAVMVVLLAAVPVIRILFHKFFMEMLSMIGSLLGLSGETRLMGEIASFLGYTAAIMAISAVFFVLSLAMMASV